MDTWHAALALDDRLQDGRTVLARRHSRPLQAQKALYPEGESLSQTLLIRPPGGIAGGDALLDSPIGLAGNTVFGCLWAAGPAWTRRRSRHCVKALRPMGRRSRGSRPGCCWRARWAPRCRPFAVHVKRFGASCSRRRSTAARPGRHASGRPDRARGALDRRRWTDAGGAASGRILPLHRDLRRRPCRSGTAPLGRRRQRS